MFLGLFRGFNKGEENTKPVLALVEARITLYSNNMFFLLIRVLISERLYEIYITINEVIH